jgi:DNA-directed RNA polymerase subunit omega
MAKMTKDLEENQEELLELDSKYRLILIAAERSKQLQSGAKPRVTVDTNKRKPTRIALEEIKIGKVKFEITE